MLQRRGVALIAAIALMIPIGVLEATTTGAAAAAAACLPAADRMPGDVPTKKTPWVLDGEVDKIVQVGNTMIAGGAVHPGRRPDERHASTPAQNLFAFDATTAWSARPSTRRSTAQVQQLLPGPTPDTVYVAGDFTKINSKGPNHIQLLNVNTGQAVASFKAPSTNGGIETMEHAAQQPALHRRLLQQDRRRRPRSARDAQRDHRRARPVHGHRRRRQPQHRLRRARRRSVRASPA